MPIALRHIFPNKYIVNQVTHSCFGLNSIAFNIRFHAHRKDKRESRWAKIANRISKLFKSMDKNIYDYGYL